MTTYDKGGSTCTRYLGCNADVEFCTVSNLGHSWSGNPDYGITQCKTAPNGKICTAWKAAVGPINPAFDGNSLMWQFFTDHPLP